MRPISGKQQLVLPVTLEELKTKKTASLMALLNSGCVRTCIDEAYARSQGWPLLKIPQPIKVKYADGTTVDCSTIRYSVDLSIRAARSVTVTGALVTRLKSSKLFLGYDWLKVTNPSIDWRTGTVKCNEEDVPLQMKSVEMAVPEYEKEFKAVFLEKEFRGLPPRRKWDHEIRLKEGHEPLRGRCYLLTTKEKAAMKDFVQKNLEDGRIR
jgi:hypothetical protein